MAEKRKQHSRKLIHSMQNRYLLQVVLFTAGYAVCIVLAYILRDLVRAVMIWLFGESGAYDLIGQGVAILAVVYLIGLILLGLLNIRRGAHYVEDVTAALDRVLTEDEEPFELAPELREAQERLSHIKYTTRQNELAAHESEQRKNDLVVYLAHDLKTPLTSVIGYLNLLSEAPDMPAAQRAKYTGVALDKAYRLEELIEEFFEITRFNLQSVELQNTRLNLTRMLGQMADEFYPMLEEKHLRVETDFSQEIVVHADPDKLARVFDNLLRNAVNYSYPDTAILVRASESDHQVTVTFQNTGDQIPPQKLERIFEKFFRLDAARSSRSGGAGLGLAIARQIVELHGGVLTAQSGPEHTVFTVVLPSMK